MRAVASPHLGRIEAEISDVMDCEEVRDFELVNEMEEVVEFMASVFEDDNDFDEERSDEIVPSVGVSVIDELKLISRVRVGGGVFVAVVDSGILGEVVLEAVVDEQASE